MTIKELINELEKYDENKEVIVEVPIIYKSGNVDLNIEEIKSITLNDDKVLLHTM